MSWRIGHPFGITHRPVPREVISKTSMRPRSATRIGIAPYWRCRDVARRFVELRWIARFAFAALVFFFLLAFFDIFGPSDPNRTAPDHVRHDIDTGRLLPIVLGIGERHDLLDRRSNVVSE